MSAKENGENVKVLWFNKKVTFSKSILEEVKEGKC